MRKFCTLLSLILSCASLCAQGSLDALEASKGLGTVKIDGMVFKDEIVNFNPYALKSRINEFELSTDGRNIDDIPIDFISVWATDLIINRVSFFIGKRHKEECLRVLSRLYGNPEIVRDMYVWKTPTITLTFRINPQPAAVKKKGQGLGIFWRTDDFERTLQQVNQD